MKRLLSWLRNAFTAQVVTFLAGILTSILVRAIFGQIIPLTDGILIFLTIVLIVFAIVAMVSIRQDITSRLIQSKLSVKVHHALKAQNGDAPIYDSSVETIASAKESIRVIGLFRPPTLEITAARKMYYQKLDEVLENKLRNGEKFRYERLIQVKEVKRSKIESSQVDRLTYEHCKRWVPTQNQRSSLTVHIRQIPDILGSISFIVIDDKEVYFAIPTITHSENHQIRATHLGTGIIFSDPQGSFIKEMLDLFDELFLDADPVLEVLPERKKAK